MKKKCIICENEFTVVHMGYSRKYCFVCSPAYERGNNDGRSSTINSLREATYRKIYNMLGSKCFNCDEDRYHILEFHHSNDDKNETISRLIANGKFLLAIEEAKKCELLCANCHKHEHYKLRLLNSVGRVPV